ncbi:ribosome hibernation-promoting factor, HPF/YfiA family [Fructilactobacillus frigidiflavus]|uniref:ribosome hibernation-promoting factor, HPF/YfiA family n=1 Tax=Fructilactobacillus frigidiflavus TaxID=3242688 RepID=UPI0037583C76
MLSYNLRGDDVEITDDLRSYVTEQMAKLDPYFAADVSAVAHVNLFGFKNGNVKAEITIIFPFLLLRGEASASESHASIAAATTHIQARIEKYQARINEKSEVHGESGIFKETQTDDSKFKIVRKKRVPLKKMTSDEAILRMDLLGHDFYIFKDVDNGTTDIVYRRKDENYGLITTEN